MQLIRVEFVQLSGWEADVMGVWLGENDDWLLLRHIPVDYVVDGYVAIAKRHIKSRKPQPHREQVERVLKLKGINADLPAGFSFSHTVGLLRWVEQQYGLVQFQEEEDASFLGWLNTEDGTRFRINSLDSDGDTDREFDTWFDAEDIRLVCFDDDYFNSMKLLWQDNVRQQWKLTSN